MAHPNPDKFYKRAYRRGWGDALRVLNKERLPYKFPDNNTWQAIGYRHGMLYRVWDEDEIERAWIWDIRELQGEGLVNVTKYLESRNSLDSITIDEIQNELEKRNGSYASIVKEQVASIKTTSLRKKPRLTGGLIKRTSETSAIPRSDAFRISIKKLYQHCCAICGQSLRSPNNLAAVESAHINPKGLDGSDDLRNGICLCVMHHWAFDCGWISIADDYTILVRDDLPTSKEYSFIRDYAGSKIQPPQRVEFAPHPLFLRAHRRLMKFCTNNRV
jgi:hypothetical protein